MLNAGKTSISELLYSKVKTEYMKLDYQEHWKVGLIEENMDALHDEKYINLEKKEHEEMLEYLCVGRVSSM